MYQCWPSIATGLPASQCLQVPHLSTDSSLSVPLKIMFSGMFKSFLGVLSYSGADVSMPAPCSYRFACLTMPAGASSVHWYLPQFSFKNYVFRVVSKHPDGAIICQCRCIDAGPLALLVCLPHNACQCYIHALIAPSVLIQKSYFQGFSKVS